MKGSGAVYHFCRALYQLLDEGSPGREVVSLARTLAVATWQEVEASPGYDPESDRRVLWAREMIQLLREGVKPRLNEALMATAEFLLGIEREERAPCGKELAAGG